MRNKISSCSGEVGPLNHIPPGYASALMAVSTPPLVVVPAVVKYCTSSFHTLSQASQLTYSTESTLDIREGLYILKYTTIRIKINTNVH